LRRRSSDTNDGRALIASDPKHRHDSGAVQQPWSFPPVMILAQRSAG